MSHFYLLPAPDIYLLAVERLGVPADRCLALEDSLPRGRGGGARRTHRHYGAGPGAVARGHPLRLRIAAQRARLVDSVRGMHFRSTYSGHPLPTFAPMV